jgi:hypothetical protein
MKLIECIQFSIHQRNHKKLMPAMLLYSVVTGMFLYFLICAPSEFSIFFAFCTCMYGATLTGIALSFKAFRSESEAKTAVAPAMQQYNDNIGYAKFDNEKV